MRKQYECTCPECGGHDISGWYDEQAVRYIIQCNECGHWNSVMNIKYAEAFPDWFELFEEESDE